MSQTKLISRRTFVAGTAGIIGGVGLSQTRALAQSKTSQAEAKYQATPNGAAKCANCTFFEADSNSCTVVDGTVAAEGWCDFYAEA